MVFVTGSRASGDTPDRPGTDRPVRVKALHVAAPPWVHGRPPRPRGTDRFVPESRASRAYSRRNAGVSNGSPFTRDPAAPRPRRRGPPRPVATTVIQSWPV